MREREFGGMSKVAFLGKIQSLEDSTSWPIDRQSVELTAAQAAELLAVELR